MNNLLVRAEQLRKVYEINGRITVVLDSVNFKLKQGEAVALVGPSGSGKTTLLHIIAGLDLPTSGIIEWPALGSRETLRPEKIALAFQGPSLLPPLTVLENVALPALLAGNSRSDAFGKAGEILERMSLLDIESKLPEELSGGQAQRVGIARALVNKPPLLLADEPTGQQDQENGSKLMSTLLSCTMENHASLIVATHDSSMAKKLSAIWSMEGGHLNTNV